MATAVGALKVNLFAETGAFVRDMGKANRAVTSGSARMNKSLVRVNRQLTLGAKNAKRFAKSMLPLRHVLAGVAAGGLLVMTKRAIEAADTIGKVADKVGFGVEALQELRFAAEQTGVKVKTLDMALQRFSRRIGEVAQGQGELLGVATQYNVKLRDGEGRMRTSIAILEDFAEVIKKAESSQERLRISFKLFDSEGAALVNLMRRGKAGIAELRGEAQRLGIVLDERMVREAEKANDQLKAMEKITSTNLTRLLVGLSDTIIRVGAAFADAAPRIKAFIEGFLPSGIAGPEELARRMRKLEGEVRVLFGTARQGGAPWGEFLNSIDGVSLKTPAARRHLRSLIEELKYLDDELKRATAQKAAIGLATGSGGAAGDPQFEKEKTQAAAAALIYFKRQRAKAEALRQSTVELSRQAEQQGRLTAAVARGGEEFQNLSNLIELQNEATRRNIDLTTEQGARWLEASRAAQASSEQLQVATAKQAEFNATIQGSVDTVSSTLSSAVNDVLFYGKTWADVTKGIGRSIITNLVGSLVEAGVQMAANFAISQAFGTAAAASAVPQGATVAAAWAPAAAMASLATLGTNAAAAAAGIASTVALSQGLAVAGFAHGGQFTVGGAGGTDSQFIPMMATPGERVTVETPAQQRAADGAGGPVTVNFNITTMNARGFADMLRDQRGVIVNIVNKAMNAAGRRGVV